MGWKMKALALFGGLAAADLQLWLIFALCFGYLIVGIAWGYWRKRSKNPAPMQAAGQANATETQLYGQSSRKLSLRYVLAAAFFILALVAVSAHGTYSPLFFCSLGLLVIVWNRVPLRLGRSTVKPVKESILLRTSLLPLRWLAVAEAKPITRDLGRAMSGVNETMMIVTSERPSIYLMVEARAFGERSAEEEILGALANAVRALAPLGVYLLPLDAERAAASLTQQRSLEQSPLPDGNLSLALSTSPYDVLSVKAEGGYMKAIGTYRKNARSGEKSEAVVVPTPFQNLTHPPLLWEVFRNLGSRVTWPVPDHYTAFLSSIFATSSEPIGTRITEAGAAQSSQLVLVRSHSGAPVELSRVQLRAVMRIYGGSA